MNFELNQVVKLVESDEQGIVIGRAEYAAGYLGPNYLIRYKAGDGRQVETWWSESALEAL